MSDTHPPETALPRTAAAGAPPPERSIGQLETELLGLAGHLAAAQCRFLQLLCEFDRRHGWAGPGLKSCAHWLSWKIGMNLRTATEHLRVAHALAALPKVTEAFAAGRISYSKVRAITRITGDGTGPAGAARPAPVSATGGTGATACDTAAPDTGCEAMNAAGAPETPQADTEQTLLGLALAGTASHVETVVRAVRRRQADPAAAAARRAVSWSWADDGSLVLRGRFAPAEGAALVAAVEALVPPREPVRHPVPPPPADWRGRAAEQAPGAVADRVGARRADALLALVTGTATATATAGADTGRLGAGMPAAPVVARSQARIVVHIDAGTGDARIDGGPELAPATAERLACDARAQVLLDDPTRNRLYLGRRRRLASPAQIAALTVRDCGRCQFPGCRHTRHLHAHHVRSWLHGGPTDVDNLVLLCSFHHTVLHDRRYRVRRLPGGWEVLRPDGTPVPATEAPLTGNVERLIESDTRAGLRIHRGSLTPTWAGERLDPQPILDALLPRRARPAHAA